MNYRIYEKRSTYSAEKENKRDNYTFLNLNYCKSGQTVLVGDSITEIYNHTELFGDYSEKTGLTVYNRGISGDTSNRLLERYEDNVLNIKPANIVLLIGTNDLNCSGDIYCIIDNIEKMINLTNEICPDAKLILLGVYPVGDNQGLRDNKDIEKLNARLYTLSKMKNIHFLDLFDKLSDTDGKLNQLYTYDGLHLNARGFEIVTNNLLPILYEN